MAISCESLIQCHVSPLPKVNANNIFFPTLIGNCLCESRTVGQESRTVPAYDAFLDFVMARIPTFEPTEIKIDYEDAQIVSWGSKFPNATIEGCLWHYARVRSCHLI